MSTLICPFCNDTDYDDVGLKAHLSYGECESFRKVEHHPSYFHRAEPFPKPIWLDVLAEKWRIQGGQLEPEGRRVLLDCAEQLELAICRQPTPEAAIQLIREAQSIIPSDESVDSWHRDADRLLSRLDGHCADCGDTGKVEDTEGNIWPCHGLNCPFLAHPPKPEPTEALAEIDLTDGPVMFRCLYTQRPIIELVDREVGLVNHADVYRLSAESRESAPAAPKPPAEGK